MWQYTVPSLKSYFRVKSFESKNNNKAITYYGMNQPTSPSNAVSCCNPIRYSSWRCSSVFMSGRRLVQSRSSAKSDSTWQKLYVGASADTVYIMKYLPIPFSVGLFQLFELLLMAMKTESCHYVNCVVTDVFGGRRGDIYDVTSYK